MSRLSRSWSERERENAREGGCTYHIVAAATPGGNVPALLCRAPGLASRCPCEAAPWRLAAARSTAPAAGPDEPAASPRSPALVQELELVQELGLVPGLVLVLALALVPGPVLGLAAACVAGTAASPSPGSGSPAGPTPGTGDARPRAAIGWRHAAAHPCPRRFPWEADHPWPHPRRHCRRRHRLVQRR